MCGMVPSRQSNLHYQKYGEANHDLRRVALHLDAVRFLVQERHNIQAGQSDFPTGTLEEAWLQILRCLIEHTFVRTGELTHQAVLVCSSFIAAISCYFENEESVEPQPIVNLLENWKKLRTELEGVMGNLTQDEKVNQTTTYCCSLWEMFLETCGQQWVRFGKCRKN